MKGVVFNLLAECATKKYGEDAWDEILEAAGLDGAYTSLATYDDAELMKIVAAASTILGAKPDDIVRWFAIEAAGIFAERFPSFYEGHETTRAFLATLNGIIHPEVRKLYPEARTPSFSFDTNADGRVVMHYHSHRRLCRFAEGLVVGTAKRFGEVATVEHAACTESGAEHCVLLLDIAKAA